jgi:ribosomal protein S27E
VSVTVTIRNDGTADMRNIIVQLYANGNSVASKTITATIKKNSDAQTTLEWTTDTVGTYTMKVTAKYGTETAKELTLTQKVSVNEKGAALGIDPMYIIIGILLVVVVAVVGWALSRKPAPAPAPMARPPAIKPAAPAVAPKKPLDEDEDEEDDGIDRGAPSMAPAPPAAPMTTEGKPKIARIKCPKCQTMKDVTSPVRPITVKCDNCGAMLRLTK